VKRIRRERENLSTQSREGAEDATRGGLRSQVTGTELGIYARMASEFSSSVPLPLRVITLNPIQNEFLPTMPAWL
jgi:hypothetical protein